MAETLVKEKVCRACGADVRPRALFCYNCGSAVAPDIPLTENNNKKVENDGFQDESVVEVFESKDKVIADEESDADEKSEAAEEIADDETAEKRDLSKMDSAANLRRRGRSVQKKRVEIVWEEHDNAPNGWFIFFAVLLTILAVVIWLISTYLG